jgi:hypothetical protein
MAFPSSWKKVKTHLSGLFLEVLFPSLVTLVATRHFSFLLFDKQDFCTTRTEDFSKIQLPATCDVCVTVYKAWEGDVKG